MKKFFNLLAVLVLLLQTLLPANVLFAQEVQECKNCTGECDTRSDDGEECVDDEDIEDEIGEEGIEPKQISPAPVSPAPTLTNFSLMDFSAPVNFSLSSTPGFEDQQEFSLTT